MICLTFDDYRLIKWADINVDLLTDAKVSPLRLERMYTVELEDIIDEANKYGESVEPHLKTLKTS